MDWSAVRGKRAAIQAALETLGMPFNGWANDKPNFLPGFQPDWAEIERIAQGVDIKKPAPKPAAKKAPAKGRTKK